MSITMTTVILFAVFGVLLFLGVPISISIVASSIVTAMSTLSWDQITFITMQKMNSGVESFSLLAVPLFILAGNIMNNGGIAKRLVNFAQLFVGKIPGSMAQANILGNMLFGALSGSSVAAASAMGGCISPIEEENGYDPAYSAAANIASAPTGLLIPPTSAFIVYSTVAGGVSISTLFMAGYIPGILMGLCCMLVAFVGAKKAGMKATGYDHSQSIAKTVWDAVPSLLLIVIVIGGIVSGIFTATEGAGVAVLYCLILSIVYKSIDFKGFLGILLNSAKTSGIILFLISASSAMSFVMAYSGIPAAISNGLMSLTDNKYIIFLLMNIILLVIGMFMDITPAILIFTPIFLPIATSFGMTEIQFGVMLIFNMCLGNITPPVGSVLFVGCGIGHVSIEQVTSKLIPYFVALVAALLAVTYIPALSLGLPSLMSPDMVDMVQSSAMPKMNQASGSYYVYPEYQEYLRKADIISIQIGSNDALVPCIVGLGEATNWKSEQLAALMVSGALRDFNFQKLGLFLEALNRMTLTFDESRATNRLLFRGMDEICDQAYTNVTNCLPQIVAGIRALNPDAKIVLLGYTNPVPLLPAWNRYFSKLNRFAKDLAAQEGLIYVDIPRAQTAADGHPTVKGHQYIANQILNALK